MNGEPVTGKKRTSPWVYVAIGCGVLVVVAVMAVAGVAFWGYRTVKRVQAEMKDPVIRTAKVKQVLGCQDLPPGYQAFMSFSIPWIMDMAILSDKEPNPEGHSTPFHERGFIYVKTIKGKDEEKMRDYMEGRRDLSELLEGKGKLDLEAEEKVGQGVVTRDDLTLRYVSYRGAIRFQGDRIKALTTIMLIECPGDSKMRMGIWFGPLKGGEALAERAGEAESGSQRTSAEGAEGADAAAEPPGEGGGAAPVGEPPGGGAAPEAYASTVADENEIRGFMSHFSPCSN